MDRVLQASRASSRRAVGSEGEGISSRAHALQHQQGLNQLLHAVHLRQLLGQVWPRVQLAEQAQGGQGRFQLVGNIGGEVAGGLALLLALLPGHQHLILQLGGRVVQGCQAVFPHGERQGLPVTDQKALHLLSQATQAKLPPKVHPQHGGQRQTQGQRHIDQSIH